MSWQCIEVAEGMGQQSDYTMLQFLHMNEKENNEGVEIMSDQIGDYINDQSKVPFHENSLIFRLKGAGQSAMDA